MDDQLASTSSTVIIEMEQLIKNHLSQIDHLSEELKQNQAMLADILNNDTTYKLHSEKAKEASKIKAATKQQILKQPQANSLAEKIKTQRSEIKELKNALSDYLREYQRLSGLNVITDEGGEEREIVYAAKLVKRLAPH